MGTVVKVVMVTLVLGCGFTALFTFSHTHQLLNSGAAWGEKNSPADPMLRRLAQFAKNVREMETRLLSLEKSIEELSDGLQTNLVLVNGAEPSPPPARSVGAGAEASSKQEEQAKPQGQLAASGPLAGGVRYRKDLKCGQRVDPLPDGLPVECDASSVHPCCSPNGWCGATTLHCICRGCIDYRIRAAANLNPPDFQEQQQSQSQVVVAAPPPFVVVAPPWQNSPKRQGSSGVVVVIIPFRDREGHFVNFKKYWQWFASEGAPRKVRRWEIYVVEQFDALSFNRGWNFNVGLAIASVQKAASPEIKDSDLVDFDCAVIQDIDYLPEQGVDYGWCEMPIQLSSEIDRFHWKTPYLASAGGIVGMSLEHWRAINGFSNEYFGWGGEDDELFHRLRLTKLLGGTCYPFCKKDDPNINRTGLSIKRPPKGFGRFSGKFMHSANHTKRITDSKAYARNIKLLGEIEKNSDRWRVDGLSNLAFRIVEHRTDNSDLTQFGIAYHHVRARRGKRPFDLSEIILAVPPDFCGPGSPNGWRLRRLGQDLPWELPELRGIAAEVATGLDSLQVQSACRASLTANFLLIDRRRSLMKILADSAEPRMLLSYYRSLGHPGDDSLIVADVRSPQEIREAFVAAKELSEPPTEYVVCTSNVKKSGPKYSIQQGSGCNSGGWTMIENGRFRAHAKPREGFQAVEACDNTKHWTQRVVKEKSCVGEWGGLKWGQSDGDYLKLYTHPGWTFCVGTRNDPLQDSLSYSRVLLKHDCGGEGFQHDFTFGTIPDKLVDGIIGSFAVCIGRDQERRTRISKLNNCGSNDFRRVAQFAAREPSRAPGWPAYCVTKGSQGDTIRPAGQCGAEELFSFAVPNTSPPPAEAPRDPALLERLKICVDGNLNTRPGLRVGPDCAGMSNPSLVLEAPSILDTVASTPLGGAVLPLYAYVEEETQCFSFICPITRDQAAS